MNILLIGSGGREHALAWALARSPLCEKLFCAPGNAGTTQEGENIVIDVTDHAAVVNFCKLMAIGLVVVGPEGPLVAGLVDDLSAAFYLFAGNAERLFKALLADELQKAFASGDVGAFAHVHEVRIGTYEQRLKAGKYKFEVFHACSALEGVSIRGW
jgi:phosphoribosylamine-glycine ligase